MRNKKSVDIDYFIGRLARLELPVILLLSRIKEDIDYNRFARLFPDHVQETDDKKSFVIPVDEIEESLKSMCRSTIVRVKRLSHWLPEVGQVWRGLPEVEDYPGHRMMLFQQFEYVAEPVNVELSKLVDLMDFIHVTYYCTDKEITVRHSYLTPLSALDELVYEAAGR